MSNKPTKDYIPPYPLKFQRFVNMPISFRKPYGFLTERSYPKLYEEIEWNDMKMMRRIERDLRGETSQEKIEEYISDKFQEIYGRAVANLTLSLFLLVIDTTITDSQIKDALWDIYTIDADFILDVRKKMTDLRTIYDSLQEDSTTALYEKFLEAIGATSDDAAKLNQFNNIMNRMVSGLSKTSNGEFVSTYSNAECKNAFEAKLGYPAFQRDEEGEFQISNFNFIRKGTYTAWDHGVCVENHPQMQTYFQCESYSNLCKKGYQEPVSTGLMEWDWDMQKCKIKDDYCKWKGLDVKKHHTYSKNGKTLKSAECKKTSTTNFCEEGQMWIPLIGMITGAFSKMYCNLGEDTTVCADADIPITDPRKNPNYNSNLHG